MLYLHHPWYVDNLISFSRRDNLLKVDDTTNNDNDNNNNNTNNNNHNNNNNNNVNNTTTTSHPSPPSMRDLYVALGKLLHNRNSQTTLSMYQSKPSSLI